MKILKGTQLLVVLLAVSSLAFGAAEEPNSERPELKFTISEKPSNWDSSWEEQLQIEKPTHVAVFRLENVLHWNPWFRTIVKARGKAVEPLERVAFMEPWGKGQLKKQPGEFLLCRGRGDRRSSMKFWLYATSDQEARKTAELLIGYAKSLADIRVRRAEADLEDYRKEISDVENEIPKLEEKKKPLEAKLAKVKEKTYFRNKDDAQRSILEWNNLLSAAEVDIIGIQAKLDMVKELRKKEQEKVEADELFWFLFRMRMAEEIELAGALARKNAALAYRDKALKFLDLAEKLDSLSTQLEHKRIVLSDPQVHIEQFERRLPQLRADVRPVEAAVSCNGRNRIARSRQAQQQLNRREQACRAHSTKIHPALSSYITSPRSSRSVCGPLRFFLGSSQGGRFYALLSAEWPGFWHFCGLLKKIRWVCCRWRIILVVGSF
ncbi:MAG: hypothetical protein ACYSTF_10400 [Planctomycetota bacterium]|jgi:hypothetical protein